LTLRAKMSVEESARAGRKSIIIEELPYNIIRKNIVESIAECVKDDRNQGHFRLGTITAAASIGCRIVVDLKRDCRSGLW
jgi:DNA gyrase subunit A